MAIRRSGGEGSTEPWMAQYKWANQRGEQTIRVVHGGTFMHTVHAWTNVPGFGIRLIITVVIGRRHGVMDG